MKFYRKELINLAHPKRIERYKNIPDEDGYIYEIQIMPGEIPDILKLDIENLVFFDIEALKPEKIIYTIGVMDSNENVKQWFIDSEEDEKRAIIEFAQFTKNNKGKVYMVIIQKDLMNLY